MADNEQTVGEVAAEAAAEASMPAELPASRPPATVGEALRAARMAQDLTVEQVAAELRIEARQLAALEDDAFEQIGVPVFVKGYIRQYGQRFGLNVADLLQLYYQQGKLADVELQPNRAIKLSSDRQLSSWIVAALVLATIVVAFAAWWWNGGSFELQRSAVAPASPPPSAAAAPATPAAAPAPSAAAPLEPAPAAEPPAAAEALPVAAEAAPEPAQDEAPPAGTAATIPLEFRFAQESWAEVSDARGERLLFGLNAAGRQVTVRGEPPFSILLGNADSVELRVDGEAYPIPTTGRQGNLARFSVDTAEE